MFLDFTLYTFNWKLSRVYIPVIWKCAKFKPEQSPNLSEYYHFLMSIVCERSQICTCMVFETWALSDSACLHRGMGSTARKNCAVNIHTRPSQPLPQTKRETNMPGLQDKAA